MAKTIIHFKNKTKTDISCVSNSSLQTSAFIPHYKIQVYPFFTGQVDLAWEGVVYWIFWIRN